MKPSQKKKISQAIKKAWQKGKYKRAFKRKEKKKLKAMAMEIEYKVKEPFILLFIENGQRVLVSPVKDQYKFFEMINFSMKTGDPLTFGNEALMYFFNKECPPIQTLNGNKILGYSY